MLNVNNLPWEVQLQILKELSSQDLLHLAAVSRHFGTICREKVLWRRLYMRDFGSECSAIFNSSSIALKKGLKFAFHVEFILKYTVEPR